MRPDELLVVIPHSGVLIPNEIPLESLSEGFPALEQNIDWDTDRLYDFRDILGNRQVAFPFCSLLLESNRRPGLIDDSVPLKDVFDRPIYRPGRDPDRSLRRELAEKYLDPFHLTITNAIAQGASFLLDGHYAVVIGYENGLLLFEDPASFRRTWLREREFLARWHDRDPRTNEKLDRFAMFLLGKEPADRSPEPMR